MTKGKEEIRAAVRASRKTLDPMDCRAEEFRMADTLLEIIDVLKPGLVLLYMSLPGEPDLSMLMLRLWDRQIKTAVPRCMDGKTIEFFEIDGFDRLSAGCFGIREPDPLKCVRVNRFDNSLCIIPGLAFDPEGTRVGNGAGYYDRFLKDYGFLKIGVCYQKFLWERLPKEACDIPMDLIVTGGSEKQQAP